MPARPRTQTPTPGNPPITWIQALNNAQSGQLMRRISWPEGQFLAVNDFTEADSLADAAFSVNVNGEWEDFTLSGADVTGTWERYIPPGQANPNP